MGMFFHDKEEWGGASLGECKFGWAHRWVIESVFDLDAKLSCQTCKLSISAKISPNILSNDHDKKEGNALRHDL